MQLSSDAPRADLHATLLRRLAGGGPPLIVFLGAGASKGAPSAVPIAAELPPLIVGAIGDTLALPPPLVTGLIGALADACTTLEHFAYVGLKALGPEFLSLLSIASTATGRYNDLHLALAHAARAGSLRAVITTNFDEYVEAAFRTLGLEHVPPDSPSPSPPRGGARAVAFYRTLASTEDFERLAADPTAAEALTSTFHPGDTVPVIKLHGTASAPESLRATIEDYQAWFLRPQKDLFQSTTCLWPADCLFIGYSAADEVFPWFHALSGLGSHYWLDLPGVSYTRRLRQTVYRISPEIALPAEEFGRAILNACGAGSVPHLSTASERSALPSALSAWAQRRPVMERFNFLARVALRLGRYADALQLSDLGLHSTPTHEATEHAPLIQGRMLLSWAKAGLQDVAGAVEDVDRALDEWTESRETLLSRGLPEGAWEYTRAEIALARAWAYHLWSLHRGRERAPVLEGMRTAWRLFSDWHDAHFSMRNFESSPEFAEFNWRMGLIALAEGDLRYARACFYRLLDVDVFNVHQIMRAKHLCGLALVHEAAAGGAKDLDPAFKLATEALAYAVDEHHPALVGDLLFCLGRICERRSAPEAVTYLTRATERFEQWHGDRGRAEEIRARLRALHAR